MNQLYRALSAIARPIFALLEFLIPKQDSACFISFPDVDDNALSVFQLAVDHGLNNGCTMIWLVGSPELAQRRIARIIGQQNAARCKVLRKNSLAGIYQFIRCKKVYFTHGHYPFVTSWPNRGKLINLWHGMPIKAIGLLDSPKLPATQICHYSIASSKAFASVISKAFNIPESAVTISGLPRCDRIFLSNHGIRELAQTAGLDMEKHQHIVCWLPTYTYSNVGHIRQDSTFSLPEVISTFLEDARELADMAERYRCLVVLKLHPMDILNTMPLTLPSNFLHLPNDGNCEIGTYEALACADGIISDISSVIFDFMCTRRPILVNTRSLAQYSRKKVLDMEELLSVVHYSNRFSQSDHFFESVTTGFRYTEQSLERYCAHFDANSSGRVLDTHPLPH